jgi:hypothetical protein
MLDRKAKTDHALDSASSEPYALPMNEINFTVPPELAGRSLKSLALGTLKLSYTQLPGSKLAKIRKTGGSKYADCLNQETSRRCGR